MSEGIAMYILSPSLIRMHETCQENYSTNLLPLANRSPQCNLVITQVYNNSHLWTLFQFALISVLNNHE